MNTCTNNANPALPPLDGSAEVPNQPPPVLNSTPGVSPTTESASSPANGRLVDLTPPDAEPEEADDLDQPANPFPIECLPEAARAMVEDVARVFKLPNDIPGSMALATAAAALGKGLELNYPPHRTRGNLAIIISAPSGTGKSEAFKLICAPLNDEEIRRVKEHDAGLAGRRAKKARLEHRAKSNRKSAKEDDEAKLTEVNRELVKVELESVSPRLITEDVTVQQLAAMLHTNRETMAVFSPDAGDFLSNLYGRYNGKGDRTDEHIYLKALTGDSHRLDRVKGTAIMLASPCLTLLLAMTPDRTRELYANTRFREGGFLARCLLCDSKAVPQLDDGAPRVPNAAVANAWHDDAVTGLMKAFHDREHAAVVRLTPEATEVFRAYRNEEFVGPYQSIQEHAAFYARHGEHGIRIALVLHALKHGASAPDHLLEASTARDGVRLVRWFAVNQAHRLNATTAEQDKADLARLRRLIAEKGVLRTGISDKTVTLRTLRSSYGFKDARVLALAHRFPRQLAVSKSKPGPTGGRPSDVAHLPQREGGVT